MIVFTWIVVSLAIIIFVTGVVSAIVIKSDATPNWRKIRKVMVWIIGLLIFRLLVWGIVNHYPKQTSEKPTANSIQVAVNKTTPYEFYWKLPSGMFIRGRNESAKNERDVEIVRMDNNSLWFNQYYTEYGSREVCRFRLEKVGEKTWDGIWEQNNPQDNGRCSLHEIVPGVWSGTITGKDGIPAFCKLIKKQK
jgi:hypothetical protein